VSGSQYGYRMEFLQIFLRGLFCVFVRDLLCEQKVLRLPRAINFLFHAAAVTDSRLRASIQIDMRLQIERKDKLQHASRLNRLVFGVALLWLVASVLLLVISGIGSARSDHNDRKNDRTRKTAHQQLFARAENQPTTRASFIS
jgi:hypothetical protein